MILFKRKTDCLFVDLGINFLGNLKGLHYGGYVPYGLLCVASYASNAGFSVNALMMDMAVPEGFSDTREELDRLTRDALEQEIRTNKPAIFALGMPYTFQYNYAVRIFKMVKEIDPDILIVVGGAHPSVLDKQCLEDAEEVDVVVRGEGEETMSEILGAYTQGKSLEGIKGVTLRADGKIVQTQSRIFMDMAETPMVNFKMLPKNFYKGKSINISPNRGCEYKCLFCEERIFWGTTVRSIPIDRVMAELDSVIKNKYDYKFITLEDSMLDLRSEYFLKLAGRLSENKKKRLGYCVTRVDSVDDAGLEAAAKAGFFAILFGVESASEKVLDRIEKGISLEKVKETLALSKKHGIYNGTLWVVGLPSDTVEESQKSYDFMESLYAEELTDIAAISRLVPYPGTPIFARPDLFNVNILHYDWERWVRFTENGCAELKEFSNKQISDSYTKIFTMARTMEFDMNKALKVTDLIRY